jgi:hypothetical protein
MTRRRTPSGFIFLALLAAAALLAGCAHGDGTSDDNRRGTFYGGISGGFAH